MTLSTLARFFIGRRQAITDIIETKNALWLGLLFVLSAGFARERYFEDRLDEPWIVLQPLVLSLAMSLLLYCLLWLVATKNMLSVVSFGASYRSFLTLFWMTAPLAWFFAIPFEHLLTPVLATIANILVLGLVALWRVVLIIRVVCILFDVKTLDSFVVVMFFTDTVVESLVILDRLSLNIERAGFGTIETFELFLYTSFIFIIISGCSWPLLLIGTLITKGDRRMRHRKVPLLFDKNKTVSRTCWIVAVSLQIIRMTVFWFNP
jgi:hypothetical protein